MLSGNRILFPVDFSNFPFTLARAADRLIEGWNAEVVLLHVMETWRASDSRLEYGVRELEALAKRHFGGCAVTRRIERGTPADRILDYVEKNDIGMVVLPSRDSAAFGKGPLGRVASEILTKASCPVWLDWRSAGRLTTAQTTTPGVCCAIDGAESAERILREATAIADRLGAGLTILSSVEPPRAILSSVARDREVSRETERVDELRRRFAPRAEVMVAAGWRQGVIARMIRNQSAQLLITGDCRQTVLAAEAICPVLRLAINTKDVLKDASERHDEMLTYARSA
jgi:nucleotide-binding universal stress UspA family protein